MFGIGMPELIVIMVIALLVFGAGRLPEAGKSLGRTIKEFKGAFEGRTEEAPAPAGATLPAGRDSLCPGCGKGNTEEAIFCRHCGHRLAAEPPRA